MTGEIPPELGGLSNLQRLYLRGNGLTGGIPPELGGLSNLTELDLSDNQLTGAIPPELGRLSNLTELRLSGNQLTGCIPEGLRDIARNDLGQLNLPDCTTATAPGAPTGLTATANGQTEIDLSWRAPSDNGGADITGYRIEVSEDGSDWSDLEANTGSGSTTYSHTGLTAGSTRHYRVSAISSAGTGTASNTPNATTNSPPNRAPVAVGTIPAWTSAPYGFEWIVVSSYFSDPDNDVLTYSAASSDPTVATSATILSDSVLIEAVALGTATVISGSWMCSRVAPTGWNSTTSALVPSVSAAQSALLSQRRASTR